jgi:hypothetical protein
VKTGVDARAEGSLVGFHPDSWTFYLYVSDLHADTRCGPYGLRLFQQALIELGALNHVDDGSLEMNFDGMLFGELKLQGADLALDDVLDGSWQHSDFVPVAGGCLCCLFSHDFLQRHPVFETANVSK